MKVESISTVLRESGIHTFIPLAFPSDTDIGSVVDVTGGTATRGGVRKVSLGIVTREQHPAVAIAKAHEINKYLQENLKGAFFDGFAVLQIEPDTPEPLYIGEENGLYTVSWNYTILEG